MAHDGHSPADERERATRESRMARAADHAALAAAAEARGDHRGAAVAYRRAILALLGAENDRAESKARR